MNRFSIMAQGVVIAVGVVGTAFAQDDSSHTSGTSADPVLAPSHVGNGEKYLIQQGDTLGKISDLLYGTPRRWKDLRHWNKRLVKNPNRIFPGFYLDYDPVGAHGGSGTQEAEAKQVTPLADAGGGPGPASVQVPESAPMTPPAPPEPSTPHEELVPLKGWTGFYAGVETGFAFYNTQLQSQQLGFTNPSGNCNTSSAVSTFFPGVTFGYMNQFPNALVLGIEASVAFNTSQNDTFNCQSSINPNVYDRFTLSNQLQTSIQGRVGRVVNWNENTFLPYLTAGASFASVGLTYQNEGVDSYSARTTQAGWLIGAGIEWFAKQDWSLRAEYSYVGYGSVIKMEIPSVYGLADPNGSARVNQNSNNVSIAIHYWI